MVWYSEWSVFDLCQIW